MKIALLTEKFLPDIGGLAISANRLANGLVAQGHSVDVFVVTTALAPGETQVEKDGITIHRLGVHKRADDTLSNWFNYVVARHAESHFDLIHAYFITQAGFVATMAARFLGIPSIVSARGNDLDRAMFDPGKAAHIVYALQNASVVTANASELVRKAKAIVSRDVMLIPNGIDTTLFAPGVRDESLVHSLAFDGLPLLGFVGEARAKKGLAPMLVAYRQVASQRRVALALVGGVRSGDDKDLLKVFQKQNPSLPLVVIPHVPPEQLPAYYRSFDLLLMPSLNDGLPNALLEGMACGCAIIGTPVGGIGDAIRDGENGRLVPPGDADSLAVAINQLLDDAELRRQLGQSARETVVRDYAPEREIEMNLKLYRSLLAPIA
jgi:glycosyltransferase involved in cell wall biosynthesis